MKETAQYLCERTNRDHFAKLHSFFASSRQPIYNCFSWSIWRYIFQLLLLLLLLTKTKTKRSGTGKRRNPDLGTFFKPDFSLRLFLSFYLLFYCFGLKSTALSLSLSFFLSLLIHVPLIKCVKIRGHMCKQLALSSPVWKFMLFELMNRS